MGSRDTEGLGERCSDLYEHHYEVRNSHSFGSNTHNYFIPERSPDL